MSLSQHKDVPAGIESSIKQMHAVDYDVDMFWAS